MIRGIAYCDLFCRTSLMYVYGGDKFIMFFSFGSIHYWSITESSSMKQFHRYPLFVRPLRLSFQHSGPFTLHSISVDGLSLRCWTYLPSSPHLIPYASSVLCTPNPNFQTFELKIGTPFTPALGTFAQILSFLSLFVSRFLRHKDQYHGYRMIICVK